MCAKRVVRDNGACDEVGALGLHALIDVPAEVAVGPAVLGAILHRSHEVGNKVIADLIALVDGGPQRSG